MAGWRNVRAVGCVALRIWGLSLRTSQTGARTGRQRMGSHHMVTRRRNTHAGRCCAGADRQVATGVQLHARTAMDDSGAASRAGGAGRAVQAGVGVGGGSTWAAAARACPSDMPSASRSWFALAVMVAVAPPLPAATPTRCRSGPEARSWSATRVVLAPAGYSRRRRARSPSACSCATPACATMPAVMAVTKPALLPMRFLLAAVLARLPSTTTPQYCTRTTPTCAAMPRATAATAPSVLPMRSLFAAWLQLRL